MSSPTEVKEYMLDIPEPDYIHTYAVAVHPNNELIVSGTIYKRQSFSTGDVKVKGVFFFTNKGMSEKVLKTSDFQAPIEILTARKIVVSSNTVFLCAEQYKEEREAQPPSQAISFDYNFNYTHKSDYVFGFDFEGTKKFEIQLAKEFTARNFDKHLYSGYFLIDDKLTVLYNDLSKKYIPKDSYYSYGYQIPVLVQITNDGRSSSPVIFKDDLKLGSGDVFSPAQSVQDGNNQISLMMTTGSTIKFMGMEIK